MSRRLLKLNRAAISQSRLWPLAIVPNLHVLKMTVWVWALIKKTPVMHSVYRISPFSVSTFWGKPNF